MSYSTVFNRKTLAWVGFFVMTSIIWRGPALADVSKIAPDLLPKVQHQAKSGMSAFDTGNVQRVIVQTKGRPSLGALNTVGILGGLVSKKFNNIDSFVAEIPASRLLRLSDHPNVARISPDRPVNASFDYNVESVGADKATVSSTYSGADGSGVTIAVIDSGVAPHPDLKADRICAWKDFVNNKPTVYDDCGHGTHVSGILIGTGAASSGAGYTKTFRGVAFNSKLVVAKVLAADGSGYTSNVIAAIDWVISIANTEHVRVINLSLGHPVIESYKDDPLCQAVERAVKANLVVVCSAGNAGPQYGTINSPANDPCVITVGATHTSDTPLRSDDSIFYYSSRGPSRIDYVAKPDIVAPGNNIVSLRAKGSFLDVNYPENRVATASYSTTMTQGDPQYFLMSGTSCAAPLVAGAAAILLEKAPKLGPNGVKAVLTYTASRMTGLEPGNIAVGSVTYDALTAGSGYLNVPGALLAIKNMDFGKRIGEYWLRGMMASSNFINVEPVLWSQDIIWKNRFVTGDMLAYCDSNWFNGEWGGSDSWVGTAHYYSDIVSVLAPKWQACWAPNPADNPDAQLWGDNAIWGGRGLF